MSLETLLVELQDLDEKTRLRAIYQLAILGDGGALPALQKIGATDVQPEIQAVARAAVAYIDKTSEWDHVSDANADIEFTRSVNGFLERSTLFSPADIQDLTSRTAETSAAVLQNADHEDLPLKTAPAASTPPAAPPVTTHSGAQVVGQYQMFWDCPACGTKKLLGVTHRFCPNCGTAQDPKRRYFPAPGEEVALENHVYYGVDVVCPACETPNSAKASFCTNCGADLKQGKQAALKQDQAQGDFHEDRPDLIKEQFMMDQAAALAQRAERDRNATFLGRNRSKLTLGTIVLGVLSLCGSLFGVFAFKFNEDVTVESHSWQRVYQIEEFARVHETRDCPAPNEAYNVSSYSVQRSRQVPDGQTCRDVCSDRRVDQGDGSYRVERSCNQQCETNYRTEYYSVLVCEYDINKWQELDEQRQAPWAFASGTNTSPIWPEVESRGLPNCDDADNPELGEQCWENREATYTLHLRRNNGKEVTCDLDNESEWASYVDGARAQVQFTVIGRIRNEATCDNIKSLD